MGCELVRQPPTLNFVPLGSQGLVMSVYDSTFVKLHFTPDGKTSLDQKLPVPLRLNYMYRLGHGLVHLHHWFNSGRQANFPYARWTDAAMVSNLRMITALRRVLEIESEVNICQLGTEQEADDSYCDAFLHINLLAFADLNERSALLDYCQYLRSRLPSKSHSPI